MALPGGQIDATGVLLSGAAHTASKILSTYGKVKAIGDLGHQIANIANLRAHYYEDSTVQERRERILDQLFVLNKMAGTIHDALLPQNFAAFQAVDHVLNTMALALAAESGRLIGTTLPPLEPAVLENAVLRSFGSIDAATAGLGLSGLLSFQPDKFLKGGLKVVGSSRMNGNWTFGIEDDYAGSSGMTRAQALSYADVTIQLGGGSKLKIDGKIVVAVGTELIGDGVADAAKGWLFQGGRVGPGDSPGTLTLSGPVKMTSGSFQMEIAGAAAGDFDQVRFTDAVKLQGGRIGVVPLDGFTPAEGTSIPLFVSEAGLLDFSQMTVKFGGFPGIVGSLQPDGRAYFGLPGHLGSAGNDLLRGGAAADLLQGLFGNDRLIGGAGSDRLDGGAGRDVLDGGSGRDTASYAEKVPGLTIALRGAATAEQKVGGVVEDTLRNIENLIGGRGSDVLVGDALANTLRGGLGNDRLNGMAGSDILIGDAGGDRLTGGAANDRLVGGNGRDVLDGGTGVDTASYAEKLAGLTMALRGAAAAEIKVRGIVEDTLRNIENLIGGTGNDVLVGDGAANTLRGALGNDRLNGMAGHDLLMGDAGGDRLAGGLGNDRLIGGLGKDHLNGGGGADRFIFRAPAEAGNGAVRDVVTSFERGFDQLDFVGIDANATVAGNQAFAYIGGRAFSETPGELRLAAGIVMGDLNGDGHPDLQLEILNTAALAVTDVLL